MPAAYEPDAGDAAVRKATPSDVDTSKLTRLSPEGYGSIGHAHGRFVADVYANDGASAVFKHGVGAFPDGAVLVMVHHERRASSDADGGKVDGPTFRMEKSSAKWRYTAILRDGTIASDGTPEACAACHEDAPRDSVFPLLVR